MSLTRDLTKLIRSKPVTDKDLEWAALFVLDTLGCALGALRTEPARMLKAVAPPETSDVPRRAFYLGGLAHIWKWMTCIATRLLTPAASSFRRLGRSRSTAI